MCRNTDPMMDHLRAMMPIFWQGYFMVKELICTLIALALAGMLSSCTGMTGWEVVVGAHPIKEVHDTKALYQTNKKGDKVHE